MESCLYVGMDDSNHAGENIKGEINLATFSLLHSDSIVKPFPNRRDYTQAQKWMRDPSRNYRFTILAGDYWRASQNNLILTAPLLIRSFIRDVPFRRIDSIRLYLDGHLDSNGRAYLKKEFEGYDFIVRNFMKKGKNRRGNIAKRPVCPQLVYMADIWAHMILGERLEECLRSEKYIPFSYELKMQ